METTSTSTPLQHKWTWAFKPTIVYKQQTAEDWMADFRSITPQPFTTVEEFWAIYNQMHTLHELDFGNIYAIFRDNIAPVWEHPQNENGYSIVLYANKSNSNDYTDKLYQKSILVLIGNAAPFSAHLNGCTLERKTGGNKIVFWMNSTPNTNSEKLETVKQILQFINIPKSETTLCDPTARVDWRDPKFCNFNIVISCRSHKARVNEQPVNHQPRYPSSSDSQSSKSRRGPPPNSHQKARPSTRQTHRQGPPGERPQYNRK